MSFEVEGKLHKKFDTESKSEKFQARDFVIETEGQYPQYVKFQLVQDRCGAIDPMNEGEKIKVYFDLRGREWQGKYFTNLNAWRIEKMEAATQAPVSGEDNFPTVEPPQNNSDGSQMLAEDLDDLPF